MAKDRKTVTRDKLTASAVDLFSQNWYDAVSVAEICRNADLSNGVFYRYYKDKEELIRQILDGFLDVIETRFQNVEGNDVRSRLISFFSFVLESNRDDLPYIAIFREGEYRFPEYEQRLRDIYLSVLFKVYEREVSISEYLYIIGSIRFLLRRPCFSKDSITAEFLADLVYRGIFTEELSAAPGCLDINSPQATENPDEADTKTKLILSGRKLIAENGFYKVNIFEVTRNAGFAVGTFYLHFSSKEEFFSEIILYLGRQLRHYIASNLRNGLNRLEVELQGQMLFLKYFETHQQNYQLVREAEFVVRETAERYYDRIEKGYRFEQSDLSFDLSEQGGVSAEIAKNFLMGISHFLGIEYLFGGSCDDPKKLISELSIPLTSGIKK